MHFLSAGILQREQEQSVIYGSVDSGKNVSSHEKFLQLVRELTLTDSFSGCHGDANCCYLCLYRIIKIDEKCRKN